MNELRKHIINNKKKYLITISLVLIVLIATVTYAFYSAIISEDAKTDINISGGGGDSLVFTPGEPLSFQSTSDNLGEGDPSISSSTTSSATLTKSEGVEQIESKYSVYFTVKSNTYEYTSPTHEPELILTITGPDGNEVDDLVGYEHITVTDYYTKETVSGYDITEFIGVFKISEDHLIQTTTQTVHNWTITITYMNLSTLQNDNQDAVLVSELLLQKDIRPVSPHVFVNAPQSFYTSPNVTVDCESATASWNASTYSLRISSLTPYSECTLTKGANQGTVPLDDYIVSKVGTTQGTGQIVNEFGYRYEGKDPNNYVYFNNEIWRIIGVFDTVLADGSTERLTKIIRTNPIGSLSIVKDEGKGWENSELNNLLNTSYLKSENGNGENCYAHENIYGNCDYTRNGINAEYSNMIESVVWDLGASIHSNWTAEQFHSYEKGTTTYNDDSIKSIDKIGLIYPSDYGFSVLSTSCARTTYLSKYNTNICAGSSWMNFGNDMLSITRSSLTQFNSIGYQSNVSTTLSTYSGSVFPVIYIKSNVKYLSGNGSVATPFKIEM